MSRLFIARNHRRGSGLAAWRRSPRRRARRGSGHLFDRWAAVHSQLVAAARVALFLDFDGTLAPLAAHPDQVRLDRNLRKLMARLARISRITVCIISGRRLADLRRRARVPGANYVGVHGWESEGAGQARGIPQFMHRLKARLGKVLGKMPGVWVEDKGISCAVHHRAATQSLVRRARRAFRQAVDPLAGIVRVMKGKKIWEVMPADSPGKGEAVVEFLAGMEIPALAVYVGDDTTDESAFAALRQGITVRVGPARRTLARFRLRDPREVHVFLTRVAEEMS